MPGFDFGKLKGQAGNYIKEHPDQVKKAEQVGEQQLKKLIGMTHGHGADDGPEDGRRAEQHGEENPEQHYEPNRDNK
jgi:hypothetical protein